MKTFIIDIDNKKSLIIQVPSFNAISLLLLIVQTSLFELCITGDVTVSHPFFGTKEVINNHNTKNSRLNI